MKNTNKKITELSPCLVDLCNQRFDKIETLEKEKDSLVNLANNRYDEIEKLKKVNDITQANLAESLRDNEKLESENLKLKDQLNLIYRLSKL